MKLTKQEVEHILSQQPTIETGNSTVYFASIDVYVKPFTFVITLTRGEVELFFEKNYPSDEKGRPVHYDLMNEDYLLELFDDYTEEILTYYASQVEMATD
jgi:hypothetical protein